MASRKKLLKGSKTYATLINVYENICKFTNKLLNSNNIKETFINNCNVLKKKHAEIKLEILEVEKTITPKKLKVERNNLISQPKQNKNKEEIVEY